MRRRFTVINDAYLPQFNFEKVRLEDTLVASAGDVVHEFTGPTYGCITPEGMAVSAEPGVGPFFEVRRDNLRPYSLAERGETDHD